MLNNNKPIKIGILEISSQNKAILEFYFESTGKALYEEVNLEDASAFIIDYDYPGAKEHWGKKFKATNKPGIIISIHKVEIPSTVWLAKPLTSNALTQAAIEVNELLTKETIQPAITAVAPEVALEVTPKHKVEKIEETISEVATKSIKTETPKVETLAKDSLVATAELHLVDPSNSNLYDFSESSSDHPCTTTPPVAKKKQAPPAKDVNKIHNSEDSNDIDALLQSLMDDSSSDTNLKTETATEDSVSTNQPLDLSSPIADNSPDKNTVKSFPKESIGTPAKVSKSTNDETIEELFEFSLEEVQKPEVDKQPEEAIEKLETIEQPIIKPEEVIANSETSNKVKLSIVETKPERTEKENIENESIANSLEVSMNSIERNLDLGSDSDSTPDLTKKPLKTSDQKSKTVIKDSKSPEEELQNLLEEIRQEAEDSPLSKGASGSQIQFNTVAEKRWFLTCGDLSNPIADLKKNTFNTDEHILSTFLQVLEEAKTTNNVKRLKFKGVIIVIDTKFESIYCDVSIMDDDFAQICFEPIDNNSIKIHNLDKSEIRLYRKKMEMKPINTHSIESFIWTISLLCSRGRLPIDTNTNLKVGLKHWPNLTRLEPIPHMMQIAAVFKKHPGTLLEIPQWLNIPQTSVFAFYNAAFALDLIEQDQKKLGSLKSISQASGKKKNRGFFSRLLNRITK